MVKDEVPNRTVVPADRAATARLLDENALDLLLAPRDGLADAALASPMVPARGSSMIVKLDPTVVLALTDLRECFRRRRAPAVVPEWAGRVQLRTYARNQAGRNDAPPGTRTRNFRLKRTAL